MSYLTIYPSHRPLVGAIVSPLDLYRGALVVVAFSLLTALAAQLAIRLPWTPVPITGQTFAVLLTGALLGWRLGGLAILAYLVQGAMGLPFFAGGAGGLHHLFLSPTSGYLLAFPLAAMVTGYLAECGWIRHFLTSAAAIAIGSLVILLGGWLWLSVALMSASQAFAWGVAPFLVGDVFKITLTAAVLPIGWKLLNLEETEPQA